LILSVFGMTKRTFKKTIGGLYKRRLITIDEDGIRLSMHGCHVPNC